MRNTYLLFTVGLAGMLLSASSVVAQQPDPVLDPLDKRVALFFEQVKSNNIETIKVAYQQLLDSKQLGARRIGTPEDRKKLEEDTKLIGDTCGAYRGFDRVYTKQVGSDLVFMKYLYKCSKLPVLWHLTFYRPPVGTELGPDSRSWQVIAIRFDTDLEVLTLLKE